MTKKKSSSLRKRAQPAKRGPSRAVREAALEAKRDIKRRLRELENAVATQEIAFHSLLEEIRDMMQGGETLKSDRKQL